MKGLFCGLIKLLLIVGAINWGLVGFFHYNLVAQIFGGDEMGTAARVVYDIVGVAGLISLICWIKHCCCGCKGNCKCCGTKCGNGSCKSCKK